MKHTQESKRKISMSLFGRYGEKSRRWKGENAGYVAKHMWINKHYKKPNKCQKCGTEIYSRLEWANLSGKHKRIKEDYIAVCVPCHRKMDAKSKCKYGHDYTKVNTFINANGHRECQICRKKRREDAKQNN